MHPGTAVGCEARLAAELFDGGQSRAGKLDHELKALLRFLGCFAQLVNFLIVQRLAATNLREGRGNAEEQDINGDRDVSFSHTHFLNMRLRSSLRAASIF